MILDINNICTKMEPELATFIHNIITIFLFIGDTSFLFISPFNIKSAQFHIWLSPSCLSSTNVIANCTIVITKNTSTADIVITGENSIRINQYTDDETCLKNSDFKEQMNEISKNYKCQIK